MNFQLQSSPFKLQLSVLVEKDASCLDAPQEQLALMAETFDVLCALGTEWLNYRVQTSSHS